MNIQFELEEVITNLQNNIDKASHILNYCYEETKRVNIYDMKVEDYWKYRRVTENNMFNHVIIYDILLEMKIKNMGTLMGIQTAINEGIKADQEEMKEELWDEFISKHPCFESLDERIGKLSGIIKALREIEDVPPELVNALCLLEWDLLDCNSAIEKNEDLPEYESEEDVSDPKENEDEEE